MSKLPRYGRQNRILDEVLSDITVIPSSYEERKIFQFCMSKWTCYVRQNRIIEVVTYDETSEHPTPYVEIAALRKTKSHNR